MMISEQKLDNIIRMAINEAIKSSALNDFFREHGGVNREGYNQDGLSDVSDDMIGYYQEFPTHNDAVRKMNSIKRPDRLNRRSENDMKYFFQIYTAKDGSSVLVGIDRDKVETTTTWGGESLKKYGDRRRRNGWNFRERGWKYNDDSDTYYYSSPARDFGLSTSNNVKGLRDYFSNHSVPPEERLKSFREYMKRHYPNWKPVRHWNESEDKIGRIVEEAIQKLKLHGRLKKIKQ